MLSSLGVTGEDEYLGHRRYSVYLEALPGNRFFQSEMVSRYRFKDAKPSELRFRALLTGGSPELEFTRA